MTFDREGLSPTVGFAAEWSPAEIDLPELPPERLRVIPLGGLGEVGKNMMVFHYGDDIVVVDCGVMFPSDHMPGVDFVLPNFSYLIRHRDKVRAILLTHGHEDHIGAIPYVWPHLPQVPIYGTRLTLGLVRAKLEEFGLSERLLTREIQAGDTVALGRFGAEFIHVVHSISDSVGIALKTPLGNVIHTGDFKFDGSAARDTDVAHLLRLADEGVLLLLSDSTYAERPGHSTSEAVVSDTLSEIFGRAEGRIIITTFASSIPRLQQIIDTAVASGRKVCFHGRSLESNVAVAQALGYLTVPAEHVVRIEDIGQMADRELVLVATGSQGEPLSAIVLMATSRHRFVVIKPGDTVIFSATPIPGNETLVSHVINLLYKAGAEVVYDAQAKSELMPTAPRRVHVSGHASRDELRRMVELVHPRYFVPIHGEYRMLLHHARLAESTGRLGERAILIEDGQVLEFSAGEAAVVGSVPSHDVYVDGASVGDVSSLVLRDRQKLAQDGVLVVGVAIDRRLGHVVSGPEVVTRGFLRREAESIVEGARQVVRQVLADSSLAARRLHAGAGYHEQPGGPGAKFSQEPAAAVQDEMDIVKMQLKGALARFFVERVGRRPIVVPIILEV